MSREDGMGTREGAAVLERAAPRRLTKREIDRRMDAIGTEVVAAFEGVEPERIEYLGQAVYARPMSLRRFIRIMSRHISLN